MKLTEQEALNFDGEPDTGFIALMQKRKHSF
jgi:hypothetical protein